MPRLTSEQFNAAAREKAAELDAWHKQTGIEVVVIFGRPLNEDSEALMASTVEAPDAVRVMQQMLAEEYSKLTGAPCRVRLELE
jgi:hypothetical protein